jgi:L-lactate dehydrogenase (cytochrome)
VLLGRRKSFGNIDAYLKTKGGVWAAGRWANDNFDSTLSWKDVEWVRKQWGGKIILKGILDAEDAKIAASTGVEALVVSNHGGRQLDGASSSIRALPEVVEAVGSKIEVLFDGGIRSGQDVLKALALGARGTMIGRAFLYGLGAMGEKGVTRALEIIRSELDVTMALCGLRDVKDASPAILR